MSATMDCRLCLEKKKHLLEINPEIQNSFFTITQMKLNKLEHFSNSVCLICYKKLLAAQGYRDMLVKIEEKLLCTFARQNKNSTPMLRTTKNSQRTLTNGASSSSHIPITRPGLRQNFSQQLKREMNAKDDGTSDEEDMSLLEEIVSFNAPDASNFLSEQDHDNHFSLLSDSEMQNEDEDGEPTFKEEPYDRPIVEIDESSNSHTSFANHSFPLKPFKCDVPGCASSSTTIKALKKHRRRVHGIRVKQTSSLMDTSAVKRPPIKKIKLDEHPLMHTLGNDDSMPFQCKFCNLILRNRRVLCRHIETVHKQAKFYCTIDGCKHASTRKDNYRLHLKNYHRNLPEEELNQALMLTKNMQPVYVNKDFEMYEEEDESINSMALKPDSVDITDAAGESMIDENESDWFVKLPE